MNGIAQSADEDTVYLAATAGLARSTHFTTGPTWTHPIDVTGNGNTISAVMIPDPSSPETVLAAPGSGRANVATACRTSPVFGPATARAGIDSSLFAVDVPRQSGPIEGKKPMASQNTSEKSATVGGACLCGEVQFEITLPTDFCAHCHCTMCRRSHGAGYVTWVGVPRPQLKIVSGKESLVAYQSSEHGQRSFCKRCGSTLVFESTQFPDQYHLPLGNLNGKIDRDPEIHVFFDDRAEWVVIGDHLPRM